MTEQDALQLGFEPIHSKTVLKTLQFDLTRNRKLTLAYDTGEYNMLFVTQLSVGEIQIGEDIVCLHNSDYDGTLRTEKVQAIINALGFEPQREPVSTFEKALERARLRVKAGDPSYLPLNHNNDLAVILENDHPQFVTLITNRDMQFSIQRERLRLIRVDYYQFKDLKPFLPYFEGRALRYYPFVEHQGTVTCVLNNGHTTNMKSSTLKNLKAKHNGNSKIVFDILGL